MSQWSYTQSYQIGTKEVYTDDPLHLPRPQLEFLFSRLSTFCLCKETVISYESFLDEKLVLVSYSVFLVFLGAT